MNAMEWISFIEANDLEEKAGALATVRLARLMETLRKEVDNQPVPFGDFALAYANAWKRALDPEYVVVDENSTVYEIAYHITWACEARHRGGNPRRHEQKALAMASRLSA